MLEALWQVTEQFEAKNGTLLTNGKVYVYYRSRTQLATTYSDMDGISTNSNPIILDNHGQANCYVNPNYDYTIIVTDAYGNEQFSKDIHPTSGIGIAKDITIISSDGTIKIETTEESGITNIDLGLNEEYATKEELTERIEAETNRATEAEANLQKQITANYTEQNKTNAMLEQGIEDVMNKKQDKLTAGEHISIDMNNVISVTGELGKTYTGIEPVVVDNDEDTISVEHIPLQVESPITFTDGVIGFDDTGFAKTEDIPDVSNFTTKEYVDAMDEELAGGINQNQQQIAENYASIEQNKSDIATNTESIDSLQQQVDANKTDIQKNTETFNNYYTKEQVDGFLKNWSGYIVVPYGEELPDPSEANLGKIYLWKKTEAAITDPYEEWICDGTAWSQIGEMSVDLSNYLTKKEAEETYTSLEDMADMWNELDEVDANLQKQIDTKLDKVSVDGTTITGDGTEANPLVSHASEPEAYTLENQSMYITLTDDTENEKTIITDENLQSSLSTLNTEIANTNELFGQQINTLSTEIADTNEALQSHIKDNATAFSSVNYQLTMLTSALQSKYGTDNFEVTSGAETKTSAGRTVSITIPAGKLAIILANVEVVFQSGTSVYSATLSMNLGTNTAKGICNVGEYVEGYPKVCLSSHDIIDNRDSDTDMTITIGASPNTNDTASKDNFASQYVSWHMLTIGA